MAHTKECLGTKEAEIKFNIRAQIKFQYTSKGTSLSLLPTLRTAILQLTCEKDEGWGCVCCFYVILTPCGLAFSPSHPYTYSLYYQLVFLTFIVAVYLLNKVFNKVFVGRELFLEYHTFFYKDPPSPTKKYSGGGGGGGIMPIFPSALCMKPCEGYITSKPHFQDNR